MSTMQTAPSISVPVRRAVIWLKWTRAAVWALCVGGCAMGWFVSRAGVLRNAQFTALGGLPGWPEVWGQSLMVLGAIALLGRVIGPRAVRIRDRKIVDGTLVAAAAMLGMTCWYLIFASSLLLGSAAYGFVPYLTLAALHLVFAALVLGTDGLRPAAQLDTV